MPELPDITIYLDALERRVVGCVIEDVRIVSPFVLRSVEPGVEEVVGRSVVGVRRVGKRIVLKVDTKEEEALFVVFHLMIAGRFRWVQRGGKVGGKIGLAYFDFADGTLALTEAGTQKRASIQVVRGVAALAALDPGGLEVLTADRDAFADELRRENHTLKRSLTDPRLFAGIGNAYSDEILHAARLSPILLTNKMNDEQITRLYDATRATLTRWIERLRAEFGDKFPGAGDITAFRPDFAVHGRYDKPCPDCGTPVQRIRYAENETNYCPQCQTGGRVLADRSLSRLLKDDWPRRVEDL